MPATPWPGDRRPPGSIDLQLRHRQQPDADRHRRRNRVNAAMLLVLVSPEFLVQ
jgi:hypothetical protein